MYVYNINSKGRGVCKKHWNTQHIFLSKNDNSKTKNPTKFIKENVFKSASVGLSTLSSWINSIEQRIPICGTLTPPSGSCWRCWTYFYKLASRPKLSRWWFSQWILERLPYSFVHGHILLLHSFQPKTIKDLIDCCILRVLLLRLQGNVVYHHVTVMILLKRSQQHSKSPTVWQRNLSGSCSSCPQADANRTCLWPKARAGSH